MGRGRSLEEQMKWLPNVLDCNMESPRRAWNALQSLHLHLNIDWVNKDTGDSLLFAELWM